MSEIETVRVAGQDLPKRIEISKQVQATLGHQGVGPRHYWTSFPYDKDAIEVMRQAGGFYDGNNWNLVAHRVEAATNALKQVDEILRSKGIDTNADPAKRAPRAAPKKQARSLVKLDDDIKPGEILKVKKKFVMVERLGAPFVGEPKYARWGKPELVGETIRYVYHRPATEDELDLAEQAMREAEEARAEAEASAEPDDAQVDDSQDMEPGM
ncbi:MAG: hypothetical protein ABJN42_12310 [Roseibium sp.]|uniref:hypothetical protein n=1 Tax=Roseibium sp. TaxID=1936156 RepID=UPI003298B9C8